MGMVVVGRPGQGFTLTQRVASEWKRVDCYLDSGSSRSTLRGRRHGMGDGSVVVVAVASP